MTALQEAQNRVICREFVEVYRESVEGSDTHFEMILKRFMKNAVIWRK
jgi:hypothetical protein